MKTILFLTFILLFNIVYSQGIKVEGFYINNNGDTINTLFLVPEFSDGPDFVKIQTGIICYDKYFSKSELKPDQAKEIFFNIYNTNYKMISIKNDEGIISTFRPPNKYFVHLAIDGKVKLYKFYRYDRQSAFVIIQVTLESNFIFQRQDGKFSSPSTRKKLAAYFSDCPELSEKIKKRKNRESDEKTTAIEFMVIDYNRQCGNKLTK
jgi:hypothetical protein